MFLMTGETPNSKSHVAIFVIIFMLKKSENIIEDICFINSAIRVQLVHPVDISLTDDSDQKKFMINHCNTTTATMFYYFNFI